MVQPDQWVWVVVQDPGNNERFLGQYDHEKHESFIPAFLEKEIAQQGLKFLASEKGHTCEVQAIQYDDLSERAAENGFLVFILNEAGEILERSKP